MPNDSDHIPYASASYRRSSDHDNLTRLALLEEAKADMDRHKKEVEKSLKHMQDGIYSIDKALSDHVMNDAKERVVEAQQRASGTRQVLFWLISTFLGVIGLFITLVDKLK